MNIKQITEKIEQDLTPIFPKYIDFTEYNLRNNFLKDIFSVSWITGYNTGASKLALITKWDFVIKIPFVGTVDEDYPDEINYFYMANSITNDKTSEWDYCEAESFVYEEAKKNHLEEFFAPTIKITKINGYPIYIQKKAINFLEKCEKEDNMKALNATVGDAIYYKKTGEIIDSIAKVDSYSLVETPIAWLTDVRKKGGNRVFVKLIKFLQKMNIEDLHSQNIGYVDDQPVFFDYSSFAD